MLCPDVALRQQPVAQMVGRLGVNMVHLPLRSRHLAVGILTCACLLAATTARAQSATGALDGIIVDQSGAVLPGATVKLVALKTGMWRTTVTDENGMFRNPLLPVGDYELTAELNGFQLRQLTDFEVMVGQTLAIRIEMVGTTLTRSTTFGRPTGSFGERIMQLAVKLLF
jgi:carboxypeptidase family protein